MVYSCILWIGYLLCYCFFGVENGQGTMPEGAFFAAEKRVSFLRPKSVHLLADYAVSLSKTTCTPITVTREVTSQRLDTLSHLWSCVIFIYVWTMSWR